MNAVDTGWITDENPHERAEQIAKTGFMTPIDEQEASSRIVDPVHNCKVILTFLMHAQIFSAIADGVKEHGKFYKDYGHSEW